jgi:TatD DNase family protein
MAVLFDSHAHLNHEAYDDAELAAVVGAVEASDVGYVVDIGFDLESSRLAAEHAHRYPWCYAAVGVHPSDVDTMMGETLQALRSLADLEKVVAIGEIGLDYHYDDAPSAREQRYWFEKQLEIGLELGMPVTIHDRDSGGETMGILERAGAFGPERADAFGPECAGAFEPSAGIVGADGEGSLPDARILLHCFSGDAAEAVAAARRGAWISIAGPVTFKNNHRTQEVAAAMPLERLLIETDAPYLTPAPHRGKRNIPPYVEYTARKIAELRGMDYEALAAATTANAKRFYGI